MAATSPSIPLTTRALRIGPRRGGATPTPTDASAMSAARANPAETKYKTTAGHGAVPRGPTGALHHQIASPAKWHRSVATPSRRHVRATPVTRHATVRAHT